MCVLGYVFVRVCVRDVLASFPGRFVGGGKTAWYRLFAHARNTPRFVGYRICT